MDGFELTVHRADAETLRVIAGIWHFSYFPIVRTRRCNTDFRIPALPCMHLQLQFHFCHFQQTPPFPRRAVSSRKVEQVAVDVKKSV
jgi:hypothetical protein